MQGLDGGGGKYQPLLHHAYKKKITHVAIESHL
jgi:hypothetical protein